MATVKTQLQPTKAQTAVIEYQSGNETVKLSMGMIRNYLVNGGGEVTDQEVMMFLNLCRFQHLNPFLREAYLIKYGSQAATMVVSKDVFIKRAMRHPNFKGMQAGIIVRDNETGEIIEREGTFYNRAEETLVGGWAKVYMANIDWPFYETVALEEYEGRTKDGKLNSQWATKGATMIRKVAQMHALREAFPDETAGMYIQEEIPEAQNIMLDTAPVQVPEPQQIESISEQPQPDATQTASAQAALFGE